MTLCVVDYQLVGSNVSHIECETNLVDRSHVTYLCSGSFFSFYLLSVELWWLKEISAQAKMVSVTPIIYWSSLQAICESGCMFEDTVLFCMKSAQVVIMHDVKRTQIFCIIILSDWCINVWWRTTQQWRQPILYIILPKDNI